MTNTYQIIINWDKGQPFSERMSAKIIDIEGYQEIDAQSPIGGPDGTKDILCYKEGKKYVVGCHFPNGQKDFEEVQDKFNEDIKGVAKNNAQGFLFMTNQKITPSERIKLCQGHAQEITIYHGERVCSILDSPKGYGVRLEYLGIELSKAEQISFLSSHLDLKKNFEEIKSGLAELNKATTALAGHVYSRDTLNSKLSTLPIAGVKFSSRLSIEDLLVLHKAIMQDTQKEKYHNLLGFRKIDVWIGNPGADKQDADFIPALPSEIPSLTFNLLNWWREEYMKVVYSSGDKKVSAIASFHEKFLSIHPFLDGNGRVARLLASIQFKDLLDKDVTFEKIERIDYYKALQIARSGNGQGLNDIFTALIRE
ncbi:MAG TPA: Fic family protein [Bacteroidia bacterium]|nr:Fic family protein [Bacteroidia bacterium]